MNFGHATSRERALNVEITSMVDVVFLLIIFFMTTAQFARETRAELDLARQKGEQRELAEEAGLIVNILANGDIVLGERSVPLDALEGVVAERVRTRYGGDASALQLTIRADRNASAQALNEVVRRLRRARLGVAKLATEQPS